MPLSHSIASWVRELRASDISLLFFSDLNIEQLHEAIRYGVFKQTQRVIDRQSDVDLAVIMRGIYLEYGENRPTRIVDQVRDLNARVLDVCVSRVSAEVLAYSTYITDRDKGVQLAIAPAPQNVSIKGDRILELGVRTLADP